MQLHEIHQTHKSRKGNRIGRGGKRGTYSGQGVKGQRSRAGRQFQPDIRLLIKRYPKLKGYRFGAQDINKELAILNLGILDKKFQEGETVSPKILLEKKMIERERGRVPKVKILGGGELKKALTIENCFVSKSAKEKIEKANGVVK